MLDPDAIEGMGQAVASIYSDAEVQLIKRIADRLQKGLGTPQWAAEQLLAVNRLAEDARGDLLELLPDVQAQLQAYVAEAAAIGEASASVDLAAEALQGGQVPATTSSAPIISQAAVDALAAETLGTIASAHAAILRNTQDVYRSVVAEVAGRTVTGVSTTHEILQQALDKYAAAGITGFTDRRNRRWHIDSYAEMATRTATMRALQAGHTQKLMAAGRDLVVVSSHANSAPQCEPFQGKVVSLSGSTSGTVTMTNRLTGRPIQVHVVASMREAESRGLHHPNCGHRHTLFVPGASRPQPEPYDAEKYRNEQKLRYHERQVRDARRRQAAATTPQAKAKADALLAARRQRLADHVAETGTPRRQYRERLRTGDAGNAGASVQLVPRRTPPGAGGRKPRKAEPAPLPASPRVLSEKAIERIERARQSLPRDRAGWDRLAQPIEVRPAEPLLERRMWESTTDRAKVQNDLNARIAASRHARDFAAMSREDRFTTLRSLQMEREQVEKKLARARTGRSVEKWAAKKSDLDSRIFEGENVDLLADRIRVYDAQLEDFREKIAGRIPRTEFDNAMLGALTEQPYLRDARGNLLPPKALEAHLDTTIDVGKVVHREIRKAFEADPQIVHLREEESRLLKVAQDWDLPFEDRTAAAVQRKPIAKALRQRESAIIHDALRQVRDLGGHQQRARLLPANTQHAYGAGAGRQADIDLLRTAEAFFPTDWLRMADARGEMAVGLSDRAFFHKAWGARNYDMIAANREGIGSWAASYDGAFASYELEVMVHELGHRMEMAVPGLTELEYALVRRRATVHGNLEQRIEMYGAGSNEFAYADDWAEAYTGKDYAGTSPDPMKKAAEVFQVGTQELFGRSSRRFGARDPDDHVLEEFMFGALTLL